jgi:NADPH:quinone reductase-like Zn-dependent oxidoreductase
LKSGDWVVQNAANSGVGRWVIAVAKSRGLRTVNIVRRPELLDKLKTIGGDVVVVNSPDVAGRIKEAVGQDDLHLALDGVSGPATGVLASTFSPGGTMRLHRIASPRTSRNFPSLFSSRRGATLPRKPASTV